MKASLQISRVVLFTCVKQCSVCFLAEVIASFLKYTYAKKQIFLGASSGDLLLNRKQSKHFISLNHEVTITH